VNSIVYGINIEEDEGAENVTRGHSEDANKGEIILKWCLNKHDYNEWTGPQAEGLSTKRRVTSRTDRRVSGYSRVTVDNYHLWIFDNLTVCFIGCGLGPPDSDSSHKS
jgi:hypothetical protein